MMGLKKLSERIYLLKGFLGHELGFDPHVTGGCTIPFSMDLPAGDFGGPQAQVATQSILLAYSSVC